MEFVCPRCKGSLAATAADYTCAACPLTFPILCGIPDFRLFPDPYIDIAADRTKGVALAAATREMSFADAVRHYYAITPDDPADLAEIWAARALAEVEIARAMLPVRTGSGPVLDIGCSTGGALIAAGGGTGVDVAFRWLVLGQLRLREASVSATLVCANAEFLPFPEHSAADILCFDTLEHLRDAPLALQEMRRVGTALLLTSNNRWAPLPEPHVHLWGVGCLPRHRQAAYVARRRGDLHPYLVTLRSAAEGLQLARQAGWTSAAVEAAPLFAPHRGPVAQCLLAVYRAVRRWPGMHWVGPRWLLRA